MGNLAYNQTTEAGDLVFTAGHVGRHPDGSPADGIAEQTRLALVGLEASLSRHGLNRAHIVRTTVYLANFADRPAMNEAYAEFFDEPYPSRSTVGVALADGILVEVDAVASRVGDRARSRIATQA